MTTDDGNVITTVPVIGTLTSKNSALDSLEKAIVKFELRAVVSSNLISSLLAMSNVIVPLDTAALARLILCLPSIDDAVKGLVVSVPVIASAAVAPATLSKSLLPSTFRN
jgi:hypothetical protein